MAVVFDAVANGVNPSSTSLTFSHTCTGSNLILLVGARVTDTNTITGVTYNGVSMTQIASVDNGHTLSYLFYLINPATGANNVVISANLSDAIRGVSASYSGTKQSGQPDASTTGTQSAASSITHALTTVNDQCWVIALDDNSFGSPSSGTNYTQRTNSANLGIGDNNSAVSPAGSLSQTVNAGGSADWGIIQASIQPHDLIPTTTTVDVSYSFMM